MKTNRSWAVLGMLFLCLSALGCLNLRGILGEGEGPSTPRQHFYTALGEYNIWADFAADYLESTPDPDTQLVTTVLEIDDRATRAIQTGFTFLHVHDQDGTMTQAELLSGLATELRNYLRSRGIERE